MIAAGIPLYFWFSAADERAISVSERRDEPQRRLPRSSSNDAGEPRSAVVERERGRAGGFQRHAEDPQVRAIRARVAIRQQIPDADAA